MADPTDFEGANKVFHPPEGMEDRCSDLTVFQDKTSVISCWKLSEEELAEVNRTGVVWLRVHGQGTPPVKVSGHSLVLIGKNERPAKPLTTPKTIH